MTWPTERYIKSVVVERVPAWRVCFALGCEDGIFNLSFHGDSNKNCPFCHGEGGEWHEAVVYQWYKPVIAHIEILRMEDEGKTWFHVTRESFLIRETDFCERCQGTGWKAPKPGYCAEHCPDCGGTGTQGEPTEWRVE